MVVGGKERCEFSLAVAGGTDNDYGVVFFFANLMYTRVVLPESVRERRKEMQKRSNK